MLVSIFHGRAHSSPDLGPIWTFFPPQIKGKNVQNSGKLHLVQITFSTWIGDYGESLTDSRFVQLCLVAAAPAATVLV